MANTIVREVAMNSLFVDLTGKISSSASFAQGDSLVWDATNKVVKVPTLEADGSTFIGISQVAVSGGKLVGPYQGLATSSSAAVGVGIAGPVFGVDALMTSKTSDAWAIGGAVYLDPATGGNGVSSTGTKQIGIYVGNAAIASASAGQQILVRIGCRYPNDTFTP